MELYILDELFRPRQVVEGDISLIWTERFNDIGEIQIEFPLEPLHLNRMRKGVWLGLDVSDRVMRIDTVEIKRNDDGVEILSVKGVDATYILKYRTAWKDMVSLGADPKWTRTLSIQAMINNVVDAAIIGSLGAIPPNHAADLIPNAEFGTNGQIPIGNIPFAGTITYETTAPMSTYDYIRPLLTAYNTGMRMYRWQNDGKIYYRTYTGSDRTNSQTVLPPVIFSRQLDNLKDISVLDSDHRLDNAVWLWSTNARTSISRQNLEAGLVGFDRRVGRLVVQEAEGLATTAERNAYLQEKGWEYLSDYDTVLAMDGQITENSQYVYNQDYWLGDLVDIISDWGYTNRSRVIEQIFVRDSEGERMYPTLQPELLVTEDSWLGTNAGENWEIAEGTWEER